jgi:hypothetical protein
LWVRLPDHLPGNGFELLTLTNEDCVLHIVSSKTKNRESRQTTRPATLPCGCTASGGSAPDLRTPLGLRLGVGQWWWVYNDETADIFSFSFETAEHAKCRNRIRDR